MANPTSAERMNRPVWNTTTTQQTVALSGGFDAVVTTGYFVIISNVGANSIFIGPGNAVPGVMVQPSGSFETAITPASPLYITGTAAQPVSVVEYKE